MKTFLILSLLLCQAALADTFSYQLYMDQEKSDKLDIKVEVVLSGKFIRGSKVQAVKVWGIEKKKSILLFDIPARLIKVSWTPKNVLSISTTHPLKPSVKEYTPAHSDTGINKDEEYDLEMKINENGSLPEDDEGMFMANQTVQEMGLNGFLKKI